MSVLMKYMLTLKHTLRKLSCTLPVVLLLDAAPVHLSERILAFASDNGIQLAFIPARLTWLLQPLDTHAFANLKRRIRKQHADLCIASPTGAVSRASTIRQQHRAILEELSDRAWARSMERVGATGIVTNLRPNIATLVAGEDLAARYPSSDDLAALLNIATSRARRIRAALRRGREPPADPRSAGTAHAAGTTEPAAALAPRSRDRSIPRAMRLQLPRAMRSAREILLMPDVRATRSPRPLRRRATGSSRASTSAAHAANAAIIAID